MCEKCTRRPQTLIRADVRFGSKADMCSAQGDVRFTPKSGHVQCNSAMSAKCQKRTLGGSVEMSAKCQDRTHAVQPKSLLDHLIGGQK